MIKRLAPRPVAVPGTRTEATLRIPPAGVVAADPAAVVAPVCEVGRDYVMALPHQGSITVSSGTIDHPGVVFLGLPQFPSDWQEIAVGGSSNIYWRLGASDGVRRAVIGGSLDLPATSAEPIDKFAYTSDGGLTWTVITESAGFGGSGAALLAYMDNGMFGGITTAGDIFTIPADGSSVDVVTLGGSVTNVTAQKAINAKSDSSMIMALANNGFDSTVSYISTSTDGGATFSSWSSIGTPLYPRGLWWDIDYLHDQEAWHCMGGWQKYSLDDGATWTQHEASASAFDYETLNSVRDIVPGHFVVVDINYLVSQFSIAAGRKQLGGVDSVISHDRPHALKHCSDFGFIITGGLEEWGINPNASSTTSDTYDSWEEYTHPDQLLQFNDSVLFNTLDDEFYDLLRGL